MTLQFASKLLLASSVATCCVTTAQAQIIDGEITGTVSSLQGPGWGSGNIGRPVTLNVVYDSSQETQSLNNGVVTLSWLLTSASIVGGPFGSVTNLEPNGPGSGTIAEGVNLLTGAETQTIITSANSPSGGFTGDVFDMSYFSNGANTTLDVFRDAFVNGKPDAVDSGEVVISNVTLTTGTVQAPEMDSSVAVGAISLLIGGFAVIRGKKKPAA